MPIPPDCFLRNLPRWRIIDDRQTWRSRDGSRVYTWDDLHGEVEVFDSRGNHWGAADPVSGKFIKDAAPGRKLNVR